ncbi:SWIM zinc finger family protein, partial [Streptomyces galilaeus]
YRGFSGEGGLLRVLSDVDDDGLSAVAACLSWQPVIDAETNSQEAGLTRSRADGALAVFAVSGRIGFDLVDGAWFHRELPLDPTRVTTDHAR